MLSGATRCGGPGPRSGWGHGGTEGRALSLSTAGLDATVLARVVLPFGCSLFLMAGVSAALCGALAPAHGGNKRNRVGGHAKYCSLELLCMGWLSQMVMFNVDDRRMDSSPLRDGAQPSLQSWSCGKGKKMVQKGRKSWRSEHATSHQGR